MLFFGLGTLPSMLATGYAASWINRLKGSTRFRQLSGLLLIGFGIWTLPFISFTHSAH
jgi:sulfite exporter TauE/SafE